VVPLYRDMIDVIDGAFVIKQINNGIQGDYQPPTNVELIDLVRGEEKENLGIPWGYAPSVFSRQLLENDFAKNLRCYEWYPDERSWGLAKECFRILVSPFLYGPVMSEEDAAKRMDRSTSPGFPLNLKYRDKGTSWDGEKKMIMDIIDQVRKTGRFKVMFEYRPGKFFEWKHIYYLVSPKGELRTVDKLLAIDPKRRKTRTFMCGDLVLYLITTMCYGNQNDSFLEMSCGTEWSAVGMTPWYGGWNVMARHLTLDSKGGDPLFVSLDAEHMEASVNDNIQTVIDESANGAVVKSEEKDNVEVTNLLNFIHDSGTALYIIGVNGWLYLRTCVNPSGKLCTSKDNTFALMLLFLYIIAKSKTNVMEVLTAYYASPGKIFGDDSLFRQVAWLTNIDYVMQSAKELGFTLKLECPVGPLRDAKFLNAGFELRGTAWYFKPNFEKIRASIFFLWKARSWRLAYVKVCAYRQLVFPFKEYRREADRMLKYILDNHDNDMRNETVMDDRITYAGARGSLMSDRDNEFLCTGYESGGPRSEVNYPLEVRFLTVAEYGRFKLYDQPAGDLSLIPEFVGFQS